jgi:hypothetical protein
MTLETQTFFKKLYTHILIAQKMGLWIFHIFGN